MSAPKKMTRYPRPTEASTWEGPVVVRGWLQVRAPWRHPIAAATLVRKWRRVRKALDTAPGFKFFEYWQRLDQRLFGMHVGWSNERELVAFDDHDTHRDIATWAIRSSLVIAMKLETFAVMDDGRVIRLGGFHVAARGTELPHDELRLLDEPAAREAP